MKESSIQANILAWLNKQPETIAENVIGTAVQSGRSDISACIRGRCVRIEVKRPDSSYDVTTKQRIYLKRWRRAGALCISAKTLDEVKTKLKFLWED